MRTSSLRAFLLFSIFISFYGKTTAQTVGQVFEDDCYLGDQKSISNGQVLRVDDLAPVGNDEISSIRMTSNRHYLRMFEDDNFYGEYRDIYYNFNDLNAIDFEDEVSSMLVRPSNTTLPTANEEVISARVLNADAINTVDNKDFFLPRDQVSNSSRIHMQGLGRNKAADRIVLTGCQANNIISGCTGMSYILLFDTDGQFIKSLIPQRYNGVVGGGSHPSSTQMIGNVFPVATTEFGDHGPTSIEFFTIDNDDITAIEGTQFVVNVHIGTLAYANINGDTYLIAGTFDSNRLFIWRATNENQVDGFQLIAENIKPEDAMVARASIDETWGEYNSFWLGKMKEDGRVVLFATHKQFTRSWADIWEINNLDTKEDITFSKIHKRWKDRLPGARPYFFEGTYPVHRPGNTPEILAFPEDFTTFIPEPGDDQPFTMLQSPLHRLVYEEKDCGIFEQCVITPSIQFASEACEGEEVWLNLFNTDYTDYKITICMEHNGGCINTVSTGWKAGTITHDDRKLMTLYETLASEAGHSWQFWCDRNFRVTVELQAACGTIASTAERVFIKCDPVVDFSIPAYVCDQDPVLLMAPNSEHYTDYQFSVCQIDEDGCRNTISSTWTNGLIPSNGIDLLDRYQNIAQADGHRWRFWCGNTYQVTLILSNECNSWVAAEQTFHVLCDPCEIRGAVDGQASNRMRPEYGWDIQVKGNPVKNAVNFELSFDKNTTVSLRLFDINGRLVKHLVQQKLYSKGIHQESFDMSFLADGVYVYQASSNDFMTSGRLIKNASIGNR